MLLLVSTSGRHALGLLGNRMMGKILDHDMQQRVFWGDMDWNPDFVIQDVKTLLADSIGTSFISHAQTNGIMGNRIITTVIVSQCCLLDVQAKTKLLISNLTVEIS